MSDYRAAPGRYRAQLAGDWKPRGKEMIFPCLICHASDGRDREHRRGCPRRMPLTRSELLALALEVEEAWRKPERRPFQAVRL